MSQRPNIVLFLTDDHGAWALGCAGHPEIRTPNLDRLASGGVRFTDATTPCPVCSPARACLMTGRTPSQHGIHDWLGPEQSEERDWLANEQTLPEFLHDAGYWTALSGKWHLGSPWTTPRGFDRCFSFGSQYPHIGNIRCHRDDERLELQGNRGDIITDEALAMLRDRPADKPFFLNVGYVATHSPYQEEAHDPAIVETYRDATFEGMPRDTPPHPWHKNEGLAGGDLHNQEAIKSRWRGYFAAVTQIDRDVGRLLDWLETEGLAENTLVVYTSDHGCALGHQGFWGKGNSTRPLNMYEVSLQVPLLARGPMPGWNDGLVRETSVDQYDLFQTLLHAADVKPPTGRDYPGDSFLDPAWQRPGPRFGEYGDLRMIRTDRHKLVHQHWNPAASELFDLQEDPHERSPLDDPPLRDRLLAQLQAWYAEHEDPAKSGLNVKSLPQHNSGAEAWRDGRREENVGVG